MALGYVEGVGVEEFSRELGIPGIEQAVLIGSGGSAKVYRAVQTQLGRPCAVKVLLGTAPTERKQFDRESRALGQLSSHPSIVTVYDAGLSATGDPYLILEYCSGGALSDHLATEVLPWQQAVEYLIPVAEALAHAHEQGVAHRDIKPGNILLDDGGRPLVADFGLARLIDADASLGHASLAAFTPGYVPPETVSGAPATRAGDVYSLGGTLYSLLTKQIPFVDTDTALNIVALARRISEEPVPDLRPSGVPDAVCALIEACMAKDPGDRPSAAELVPRLRELASGSADAARIEPPANDGSSTMHLSLEELARPVPVVEPAGQTQQAPTQPVPVAHEAASASPEPTKTKRREAKLSGAPRLRRTKALLGGIGIGLIMLVLIALCGLAYLYLTGEDISSLI